MKQRNPSFRGHRKLTNVLRDEAGVSSHEVGNMNNVAGGDFLYEQRGVQPNPTSAVPLRVQAMFGATIQGRR